MSEILGLARNAPSSMDGQPWRFVVVRDRETLRQLARLKNQHCDPRKAAYPADFLAEAPVVVAVCVETTEAHDRARESGVLAAAYLMLAAHHRGLGSVYLTAYQPADGGLAQELGALLRLPPDVEAVALIPLGFPAEQPPPKDLRPLSELIHYETYGGASGA